MYGRRSDAAPWIEPSPGPNLSPRLIPGLTAVGIFAQHVARVGLSGKSDSDVWRLSIDRGQTLLACGLPLYISKAHGMIEAPDKNLLWRIPAALNLSAQESIKIRRRPLKSDCFDRSSVGELTFIR